MVAVVSDGHDSELAWPHGFILKVTNKQDSKDPAFSEAQNLVSSEKGDGMGMNSVEGAHTYR